MWRVNHRRHLPPPTTPALGNSEGYAFDEASMAARMLNNASLTSSDDLPQSFSRDGDSISSGVGAFSKVTTISLIQNLRSTKESYSPSLGS